MALNLIRLSDEAETLNNVELAEKANVAVEMCASWAADVEALEEEESPDVWDIFNPVTKVTKALDWVAGGSDELKAARQTHADWCKLGDFYARESARRRTADPTMAETEAEVASELEETREEHRAEARRIEREWEERGGAVGAPLAAAVETVRRVPGAIAEETMGFFGRVRENIFGVFGLASDMPVEARIVGLVRLVLAAVAIYLVYIGASRFLVAGATVAERSAERGIKGLVELKDMPIPGA